MDSLCSKQLVDRAQTQLLGLQLTLHLEHRLSIHAVSTASWAEHATQYSVIEKIV